MLVEILDLFATHLCRRLSMFLHKRFLAETSARNEKLVEINPSSCF